MIYLLVLWVSVSKQEPRNIQLKPPNLSGRYQINVAPFEEKVNDVQIEARANTGYPCNGTFKKTNGTTCGLKEIMLGRCYEYQYIKRGLYLSNTT